MYRAVSCANSRLWFGIVVVVHVMRLPHAVLPHLISYSCRRVQEQFPGADIVASTFDEFVEPLLKAAPSLDLPVVSQGSTVVSHQPRCVEIPGR